MLNMHYGPPNRFGPGRSAVIARRGAVATSYPLAALAGLQVLQEGGNAVDAAIATAAMLCVVEPMSTGVGGDAFALVYQRASDTVYGLNASGRAPLAATPEAVRARLNGADTIPSEHILAVTVPGAVDGWFQLHQRFGSRPMSALLEPAIQTAQEGFPLAPQIGNAWRSSREKLARHPDTARTWLNPDGSAPGPGSVFRVPALGRTLALIAEEGRDAFYRGPIAEAIVRCSDALGGLLTLQDFEAHTSTWVEPIAVEYRGYRVLELPPNGQGIAALEALNILALEDLPAWGSLAPDTVHFQIEAMKLAFHDRNRYVTDPEFVAIPIAELLSPEYARRQHKRLSRDRALPNPTPGDPTGDTVYLCTADADGNMVSFIQSLYVGWGSGITAGDTGVVLQNRGASFSLDPTHANVIAPGKRTRHTIIPGMLAHDDEPIAVFGVMGGDMQAQGHVQFVCNLVDFGMNVQDALDAPRWRYNGSGASISLEAWMPERIWREMERRGHQIAGSGGFFGGGQAIVIDRRNGVYHAGSDPRRDGCALGF